MKRNLLYIIGVVCMMTSCIEEQNFIDIVPTPGEDVLFSAELSGDLKTRTLYGPDASVAIKVNWVQDDTVLVYGTDCAINQAVYSVDVTTAAIPNGAGQNFADKLVKTKAAGIQWGKDGISDFYAVYPSTNARINNVNGTVSISTSIDSIQNYVFNSVLDEDGVWRGSNFGKDALNPSMSSAVMFAHTKGATSVFYNENGSVYTDANGNTKAKPVDLHFKPFSTVLKFRFEGFVYDFGEAVTNQTVYVQSIKVTAPSGVNISGDFDITNFTGSGNNASAKAEVEGKATSNTITINTMLPGGTFLPLEAGEPVEFNVFTIPQEYKMSTSDLWTVTINANVAGTNQSYTYKMLPIEGAEYTIASGEIHKLKIPSYSISTPPTWDPSKWITQIPPKVYLSELSLPGTWYSVHSAYQNTTNLQEQYNAGIRAFNIDCRMSPSSYDNGFLGQGASYGPLQLVCAGTDKWTTGGTVFGSLVPGTTVLTALQTIAAQIPSDEYVVVVLTVAEKPLTSSGSAHGGATVDPAIVIPAITSLLNSNTAALKLYTSKITSETTVEDVLGHMIVKINTNNSDITSYTYPNYALVSYASMAMTGWNTDTDNITDLASTYYTQMQTDNLYWGNDMTDLVYYYHQCQRTVTDGTSVAGVPTVSQRKAAIDNIIENSTDIYNASTHNGWFQLGIGGYIDDGSWGDDADQAAISTALNQHLADKIEAKMDNDPSPVGIVLMNHATVTNSETQKVEGIQLVKDIIEMNGKFYLKRKGGDITTGETNSNGDDNGAIPES